MNPPQQIDQAIDQAIAHHRAGRLAEAEIAYRKILDTEPNNIRALNALGALAGQIGHYTAFLEIARRIVQAAPHNARAQYNLGLALSENGLIDEAIRHLNQAINLQPDYVLAIRTMATMYLRQGLIDKAIETYRRAVELDPASAENHSSLLYTLHFHPDYDAKMLLAEHRRWAEIHERPLAASRPVHINNPDPARRLKIGYVSSAFCKSVVAQFLQPLFAHHDRAQFETICYSSNKSQDDSMTRRLRGLVDQWRAAQPLDDAELAHQIQADQIDLLVDLDQHAGGHRLLAFARKPAPIQIAWLSYPCTTGLAAMDYRLTDPFLDPPGQGDENYTEKSIRLPHCFWCYQPAEEAAAITPLPATANGLVTFGCFNRFDKVTAATLALWRQVLLAVPNSRLMIHSNIGAHLSAVRLEFERSGIASRRLEFVPRKIFLDYFQNYSGIDIALDPFPYGGGTVTCDALYMGVPIVTLRGPTAVGRGGTSLLSNVGLPDLIAQTPDQYVSIAAALAADLPRLAELRKTLRAQMESSPLMDGRRFTADMESVYRRLWTQWCQGRQ